MGILDTRNIPKLATVAPTIKEVALLFQKYLLYLIAYLVSFLIYRAA